MPVQTSIPPARSAGIQRSDDLDAAYDALRILTDTANRHDDEAHRIRNVIDLISAELAPLRTIFDPIRTQHTIDTWEGHSADASRRRLDEHEDRCLTTIRTLDALIDELGHAAAVAVRTADLTRDEADSVRHTALLLERELNGIDTRIG